MTDPTKRIEPYVDAPASSKPRTSRTIVFGGVIAVVALGITGAVAFSRTAPAPEVVGSSASAVTSAAAPSTTVWLAGPCADPTTSIPARGTPEFAQMSKNDELAAEESARTGWAKFQAKHGSGVWYCGYEKMGGGPQFGELVKAGGSQVMYDAVDGKVIGYSYVHLGFFLADEVAAPGFDPSALRVARNGCDPLIDRVCQPKDTS